MEKIPELMFPPHPVVLGLLDFVSVFLEFLQESIVLVVLSCELVCFLRQFVKEFFLFVSKGCG
jgi:hypothetical protein